MNQPNWTEIIQAACSIITAPTVIITLLFTWRQIKLTAQQIRQASRQAERESEDRNRPYVSAQVVPSISGMGAWDLRIRNTGGTTAKEITIRLIKGEYIEGEGAHDSEIYNQMIALENTKFDLQPDTSLRIYWSFYSTNTGEVEVGAPLQGTIGITYHWRDESIDKLYRERVSYDCETPLIPVPSTGVERKGRNKGTTLINIEHTLRSISSSIGELNR